MEKESSFDHETISSAGALGLMQIMPSTAKELGVNPKRAEENIEGGIRYLRQQLDKYEGRYKVHYALASYNAGAGAVRKYGGIPPYTETQNYIRKIVEKYNKLKQSENREVIGISGNEKSKLPIAEAGNIKVKRGKWNDDFFRELENFPEATHDDIVDALSGAFLMINKPGYSLQGMAR